MSFILDALRKSETERQRQTGPGLADAGYRPPARKRGLWLPVLVLVLGANVILMATFWLQREPVPAVAPAPTAAAMPVATPANATPMAAPAPEATAEAEFAAVADLPAEELAPAAEAPAALPEPATAEGGTSGSAVPEASQVIQEGLPSAQQLAAAGSLSLPDMRLDIHVFSTTPAERFVFINMRRYTEGAQLSEGPRVEEITRDGVVLLSQDGRRFVLARD